MAQSTTNDHAPRRPLKIALFSGNYNNVVDGPVKALNRLVGFLLDRGHEVLVFAPTIDEPAIAPTGTLISVPSVAIPGRSEYRLAGGLNQKVRQVINEMPATPQGRTVKDRLADFQPDIIHLSAPDYLGYRALKYADAEGIPAVASFHTRFDTYFQYYGAGWLQPLALKYMRHFYSLCRHVYVPSPSMGDALREVGIGDDIRMWTRGVDGTLFSPEHRDMGWRRSIGFDDTHVLAVFVGRIVLEKGLQVFADAFQKARAEAPALRALVIGDGPERKRFEGLLPADSHFTGTLHNETLAKGYASADIFLNPSITETFGNVTLEAMASGLPSVCAAASGSVSLIRDRETGRLGPPTSEGMAPLLKELALNATQRQTFGRAARQDSRSYDWVAILENLVENYREAILAGPRYA